MSGASGTGTGPEDLQGRRIGFVGCGAMARALAGGLRAAGHPASGLAGADPDAAQRERFAAETGAQVDADNAALVAGSDVVVLAVKPGVLTAVLGELSSGAALERPLWISIAAGVPLRRVDEFLPERARVVRAMPNTPALVRAGATAFFAGAAAEAADRRAATALFEAVGEVWEAPGEELLDAVTGVSGSGPAYVFVLLEALGDAGVRQGLPREAAYRLAFQTVAGAARLAQESGLHPAQLKDQVTSPGGTTIAGLERLEASGLRAGIHAAVAAAAARARELAD